MPADCKVKAAQYLRMSTDHQRYSLQNQAAAIQQYAIERGFEVVCTYADAGRSGLTLSRREQLKQLLADVLSGQLIFKVLLIYDVSRWGRFQDTDESAHYEWLIRNAGVEVHYCAETFENDGSLTSAIMKNLKRIMAGEYSRDLSSRVLSAQIRQFQLGYRMGGSARYGLRRLLLNGNGEPKMVLQFGDEKNVRDDKVILIPGPEQEILLIKRIFYLSTKEQLTDAEIADLLNSEGLLGKSNRPWTKSKISQIIVSEIYTGTAIFNRTTSKLRGKTLQNPREQWIKREKIFDPIISQETFREAQKLRRIRGRCRFSEEELLEPLRRLLAFRGKLSGPLIARDPNMPKPHTYRRHFGSLNEAYAKVGYFHSSADTELGFPTMTESVAAFCTQVARALTQSGSRIYRGRAAGLIIVDKRYRLSTAVSRLHGNDQSGLWHVFIDSSHSATHIITALASKNDESLPAYYLFPSDKFSVCNKLNVTEVESGLCGQRLSDLSDLYGMLKGSYLSGG